MGIKGITKNIALRPVSVKNIDKEESFVPVHTDLRNGFLTDVGNWNKRPGYAEHVDLGTAMAVELLIPEGEQGYAATSDGRIFRLGVSKTSTELTGKRLSGQSRPTWVNHQGTIIICDGGTPVRIFDGDSSVLPGAPPPGKYVDSLDTYVLISGHDATTFRWSTAANSGSWPAANFNSVLGDGEEIRFMKVFKRLVWFFKSGSIETWADIGGSQIFARQSVIERGCIASYSVVQANDTFYWFGDDGDFYVLDGLQPRVISKSYRRELDKLVSPDSIYGFDYRKEHLIRWFAPQDGKCFVFDYTTNTFSEDNTWRHGQWDRLPHKSYMEINNRQYFGDYNLTGLIYEWSKDYKDDNGLPIRVFRDLSVRLSGDGTSSRVNRIRLRLKRGVAVTGETTPEMLIRWRFDHEDWGNYESLDLGVLGDADPYIDIHSPVGIGSEMNIQLVETDAVDYLLTDVWLTIQPLRN